MGQNTPHIVIGKEGENVALQYLVDKGYVLRERNARNNCGEIDLVMAEGETLVFVEVKTTRMRTHGDVDYRPIDNLSRAKIHKLHKAISTYCVQHRISAPWRLDAVLVELNPATKQAQVQHLEHISTDW